MSQHALKLARESVQDWKMRDQLKFSHFDFYCNKFWHRCLPADLEMPVGYPESRFGAFCVNLFARQGMWGVICTVWTVGTAFLTVVPIKKRPLISATLLTCISVIFLIFWNVLLPKSKFDAFFEIEEVFFYILVIFEIVWRRSCRNVLLCKVSRSLRYLTRTEEALASPNSQSATVVWLKESTSAQMFDVLRYCFNEKGNFMLST